MADLVAEDAGQLVLVVGEREEPARDVDVAAGQREGVRLLHVDDRGSSYARSRRGDDGDEPLRPTERTYATSAGSS